MKVNEVIHQNALNEIIRLKKENNKILLSIKKDSQRVSLASNIVNRFYQIKPIIQERKGAFTFNKWKEISILIELTDKFKSINDNFE